MIGEAKARSSEIIKALHEASVLYGDSLLTCGYPVLAAGVAGDGEQEITVRVQKRGVNGWAPITFQSEPIQWLPTPEEADLLLRDQTLFRLDPQIPSAEILAARGDELNRILRESKVKDEFRPATIAAFMLALWDSKGDIRLHPDYVLADINAATRRAFQRAGKFEIAESIYIPEANEHLASQAGRIVRILRLLNVTNLTAAHDYLGQLYETFFRFTGGNTIGQFFTPRHVTRFMVDVCEIGPQDVVVDPTCGTGGFLVSALHRMIGGRDLTYSQVSDLVSEHLEGFESEPITAALCVTNMILRGDGTTGVVKGDSFTDPRFRTNHATVVIGNPPFPHRKTDDPTQKFVDRALEALRTRGELAMIVPGSLLVKRGTAGQWRQDTLRHNSLLAVISLPNELFEPYASATTAIVVIKKGVPHPADKLVFFGHIENDGYTLRRRVRVEQPGEQLSAVLDALKNQSSVPGLCTWKVPTENEWSPGAYIDSVPSTQRELESVLTFLINNLHSFEALHAQDLDSLRRAWQSGGILPQPYEAIAGKMPYHIPEGTLAENAIGKLYDLYYGQSDLENKRDLLPGPVPIISSAGSDNGCYGFFDITDRAEVIQPPFVTVPRTGSIGEAFVQRYPCSVTSDCLLLIPKNGTTLEDLYLTAAEVRREKWRFNYGRKVTPARIAGLAINSSTSTKLLVGALLAESQALTRNLIASHFELAPYHKAQFAALVEDWKQTRGPVDVSQMVMHSAYQQIIGTGRAAIPLILEELRRESDHWFWALSAITGEDPVEDEDQGRISRMREAWLDWGIDRGYIE